MRTVALIAAAFILALGVAWNAGEAHRRNCITVGNVSCSMLPWDNGHRKPPFTGWGSP